VEVYRVGISGILKDFKELEIHGSGKPERQRLRIQDKGQAAIVRAFLDTVKNGGNSLISMQEVITVTRATFRAAESLRKHEALPIIS